MNVDQIIDTVCEVCGIRREDLYKRSRAEPLPTARALIAHFLYRELKMGPRDITPLIGHPNYNRTVVYHYVGKETLIEARSPFQKDLKLLKEKIERIIYDKTND